MPLFLCVRLAVHVSKGLKSRIHPVKSPPISSYAERELLQMINRNWLLIGKKSMANRIILETIKRTVDFSAVLVYNVLRKVIGSDFRLPSVV